MTGEPVVPTPSSPTPDGPVAELWRLASRRPRATDYQHLCCRLTELALDLPADLSGLDLPAELLSVLPERPGGLVRHGDGFPEKTLCRWVEEVLEVNILAGVVLTDALAYGTCLVPDVIDPCRGPFPDIHTRKRLTRAAGEYGIEFVVPPGWEFEFDGQLYPEGFSGVASVKRCHLSGGDDRPFSSGRLVDDPGVGEAIGFDIPCDYFPRYQFDGDRLVNTQPGDNTAEWVAVPYAFVRRAFWWPGNKTIRVESIPRPSDEGVFRIAMSAAAQLRERATRPARGASGQTP